MTAQASASGGFSSRGAREVLKTTEHRPWPLPRRPFAMRMSWHDLLFAHWPVPRDAVEPHIPPGLELETWDGWAWIGVVPFYMTHVTGRGLPAAPWLSAFEELNVRTYVRRGDKPGVWFFSLDAARWPAVVAARRLFHLPYFHARFRYQSDGDAVVYQCERRGARTSGARFTGTYGPQGPVGEVPAGGIEDWLVERYCLYAAAPDGTIYCGDVHHEKWPLQPARADIDAGGMTEWLGIELRGPPELLHFSRRLDVVAWSVERASS